MAQNIENLMKTISEKLEISHADIDEQMRNEVRKIKQARFELNKTTLVEWGCRRIDTEAVQIAEYLMAQDENSNPNRFPSILQTTMLNSEEVLEQIYLRETLAKKLLPTFLTEYGSVQELVDVNQKIKNDISNFEKQKAAIIADSNAFLNDIADDFVSLDHLAEKIPSFFKQAAKLDHKNRLSQEYLKSQLEAAKYADVNAENLGKLRDHLFEKKSKLEKIVSTEEKKRRQLASKDQENKFLVQECQELKKKIRESEETLRALRIIHS